MFPASGSGFLCRFFVCSFFFGVSSQTQRLEDPRVLKLSSRTTSASSAGRKRENLGVLKIRVRVQGFGLAFVMFHTNSP